MPRSQKARARVALLREKQRRLHEVMHISLKREQELFEEWQDDPLSEFRQALWEKQRQDSKAAIVKFEKATTAYLAARTELSM